MSKKSSFYIIIILIISIPTINIFENVSKNFLFERSISQTRTPYENVKSFLNSFLYPKALKNILFRKILIWLNNYFLQKIFMKQHYLTGLIF